MEKELDPEIIKTTQLSLGKYVKRPPLSEKLLKKPPFRFLHDIVTTVLKTTGFFGNLFDEEELISENVKDRDGSTTGKTLAAKPSKIVAGQEPEKTNELLQCLAQALDEKLSSEDAVRKYKETSQSGQVSETKNKDPIKQKSTNVAKKLTSKSSEKLSIQRNDVSRSTTKQDKDKANDVKSKRNGAVKADPQTLKKSHQSKTINAKKDSKDKKDNTPPNNKIISSNSVDKGYNALNNAQCQSMVSVKAEDEIDDKVNVNQDLSPRVDKDEEGKLNSSYTIAENDLVSSSSSNDLNEIAKNNNVEIKPLEININKERTFIDIDNEHQTKYNDDNTTKNEASNVNIQETLKKQEFDQESDNKNMNADKYIDPVVTNKITTATVNDSKIPRPPSVRPSSSRPGAPRMREKLDNVIKDPDNLLLGKVNIIIENTQNEEEEETSLILMEQHQGGLASPTQEHQELNLSLSEHGHLVQQILDSQKELTQIAGKTEIEWQFGAQKAREAMNQEIEQFRFNIQALSRVANPLGKLLDHVQEDVEVMRQELHQWSNIYEDVTKEMHKQKSLNEDSLTPFYTKLKQIKSDIEEKHDKINDLKILIHKNAFRIEKLLTNGNVQ